MRPASFVLALLATAAVSVGASGLLFSNLTAQAPGREPPSLSPVEQDRLEAALARMEAQLGRLIEVLEGQGMARPLEEVRRVEAGGPVASLDVTGMADLVERLEQVGAQLERRTSSSAFTPGGPLPLIDKTQPTNWTTFSTFFGNAEESTAEELARGQLLLYSLGEVVTLLGRPTNVWGNEKGITLNYEEPESGREMNLQVIDGYVTYVDIDFD